MRVVCDQKNVFPFDGEHVHFMQASDKSVTSSQFTPAEGIINTEAKPEPKVEILLEKSEAEADGEEETDPELFEIHEIELGADANAPPVAVTPSIPAIADEADNGSETTPAGEIDPNDFREKIKRRLQRALQSKKK